jgi:bifunctional non-homologous end joining protein LigD
VTLYTRSGLDWTDRFPTIAAAVRGLPANGLVIDGELISADASGRPDFSVLQDDLKRGRHDRMVYYAFDLLHLDGFDTRAAPLIERKRLLRSFLAEAGASAPRVIYSEHFEDGADLYRRALGMGLGGIVSKRADAPYRSGRTEQWCKVKCWKTYRFAVVGFVLEETDGPLKLRLAWHEGSRLIYAEASGRAGTVRPRVQSGAHSSHCRALRRRSPNPPSRYKAQGGLSRTVMSTLPSDIWVGRMVQRPVFQAFLTGIRA